LAWQSVMGRRDRLSRQAKLPAAAGAGLALLYLLAVIGGQAVTSFQLAPTLTLPAFHLIALTVPPLLILLGVVALAKGESFTWRQMIGGLGGGAFGAAGLAFAVEAVLLVIGVTAVALVIGSTPDGANLLGQLRARGGNIDLALLRALVRNPITIITLLVGLSVIVPLIEESAKSLTPLIAGTWQALTPARGLMWGVASGAGFALLEGLLNGGLNATDWTVVAVLRVGSSAMHCVGAGLTGWGLGQAWTHRRWLYLVAAYLAAFIVHGAWNAISLAMGYAPEVLSSSAAQSAVEIAAVGMLALMTSGAIVALMWLARQSAVGSGVQQEV
jgi:hypothetical protein